MKTVKAKVLGTGKEIIAVERLDNEVCILTHSMVSSTNVTNW